MKKMIIAACAVFALTSCSDFLEETPVGELTPEQAQDPNNIEGIAFLVCGKFLCSGSRDAVNDPKSSILLVCLTDTDRTREKL